MARTELPHGVILPAEYSDDWYGDMTSNLTRLDDVIGSNSEKLNSNDVAFLRMSSAALTDGGTGNFSDLNSSNKLKTGDYVLDSNRKLFMIASVDSANETFTVGNSLFKVTAESDLAPVAESGDYDDLTDLPTYGITRFCSVAITDNSSVAFSNISSTNKIKVGDFLLDTNGKLYQISAVDTVNETAAVTTHVTQLALDANVMHLSGNENASGIKTFTSTIKGYNSDSSQNTVSIDLRTSKVARGNTQDGTDIFSLGFRDKNNDSLMSVSCIKRSGGSTSEYRTVNTVDNSNNVISRSISFNLYKDGTCNLMPEEDNQTSLGSYSKKWKNANIYLINAVNPGVLSLPSQTYLDISSYFTNTGTGETNSYTAPANGWIFLRLGTISSCQAQVLDSNDNILWGLSSTGGVEMITIPILSGCKLQTQWETGSTVNVANARFFPCQGNI